MPRCLFSVLLCTVACSPAGDAPIDSNEATLPSTNASLPTTPSLPTDTAVPYALPACPARACGVPVEATVTWHGEYQWDFLGLAVRSGQDATGDGVTDLVATPDRFFQPEDVKDPSYEFVAPLSYVLSPADATSGSVANATGQLVTDPSFISHFSYLSEPVPDLTGDGIADVVVQRNSRWVILEGPVVGRANLDQEEALAFALPGTLQRDGTFADFDGDGVNDAAFTLSDGFDGWVYVYFGPFSGEVHVGPVYEDDADLVFTASQLSTAITASPDLTGDGIADLVIHEEQPFIFGRYGAVRILSPTRDLKPGRLHDQAAATLAADSSRFGAILHPVGDLDGDGNADLVVVENEIPILDLFPDRTFLHVFYGPFSGEIDVVDVPPDATIVVDAEKEVLLTTAQLAAPGDVTGDGVPDLVVGRSTDSTVAPYGGAAYVFAGPIQGTLTLADAVHTITGEEADRLGTAVVALGDIDGDNLGDLAIGAPQFGWVLKKNPPTEDPYSCGCVHLVPGRALAASR